MMEMKHMLAFLTALLLAPLTLVAAEPPPFRFEAPPGPQFSAAEKQTQRDKGAGVVPMVRKAFETMCYGSQRSLPSASNPPSSPEEK